MRIRSGKQPTPGGRGVGKWAYYPGGLGSVAGGSARAQHAHRLNGVRRVNETAEQRDAADEGRLEPCGSTIVGNKIIVGQGEVVRPSQLIASVLRTR
jgi:hypothetical protein